METLDYTKLSVAELRTILIKDHSYQPDDVNAIKGKASLVFEVKKARGEVQGDEAFEAAELDEEGSPVANRMTEIPGMPEDTDPGWHDFIMQQFTHDELVAGYPNVNGLRRMCEKYVGIITHSGIKSYAIHNDSRIVEYQVTVDTVTNGLKTYSDIAEADGVNTPSPFNKHLVSTAASRAASRVLRQLLKLRCPSAEEMGKEAIPTDGEKINSTQIAFIKSKTNTLGIDVMKFVNTGGNTYKVIEQVPYSVAAQMTQTLSQYQNGELQVPEEIKKTVE